MIHTVDDVPRCRPPGRNGAAVAGAVGRRAAGPPGPAPLPAGPPDVATGPAAGVRPHHDQVTAVHDAIDFARALVADGGTQTAGLTMLRAEVGHLQREIHAWRQELAATRQDVDRLRADLLRLSSWTRGPLVDRLAAKFAQVDAALARAETGAAGHGDPSGRDLAQMRAGFGPPAGPPDCVAEYYVPARQVGSAADSDAARRVGRVGR